jgi:hypothetical protein
MTGSCGLGASDSGKRPAVAAYQRGNEPSGSVKMGNILASSVAIVFSRTLLRGVG